MLHINFVSVYEMSELQFSEENFAIFDILFLEPCSFPVNRWTVACDVRSDVVSFRTMAPRNFMGAYQIFGGNYCSLALKMEASCTSRIVRCHNPVNKNLTSVYFCLYFQVWGVLCLTVRWVPDWMIGCIYTLVTLLGTIDNYSAIADLHTLQFTVTQELDFSVFTSRILATDL
jgi:hypothetical protein